MDNEEFEQIPWSSLMPDKAQGVDPKVYVAVGVVGLVIAVIFGARIFGGSSAQPVPPVDTPAAAVSTITVTSTAGLVVSEADLMAGAPNAIDDTRVLRQIAFAEWFVTDYYTVDGSEENERSVRQLLASTAASLLLPHSDVTVSSTTYVEWARSVEVRDIGDAQVEVDVVYRTITETDAGFVRDPVSAVLVTVRSSQSDAGITGLPVPIDVPTPGSQTDVSNTTDEEDS